MNIGIFTDTYSPQINGVVTSVRMLEDELRALGHNVYIFTSSDPTDKTKTAYVYRMPSVPMPSSPGNRAAVFFRPTILAKIGRMKLDVVHTQSEFPMGFLGIAVAAFARVPLVHTYHTIYEDYVHYIAKGRIFSKGAARTFSRWFCNRASAVIAPVEKARDLLRSYGVEKPIHVIPTGINFAPFERTDDTAAYVREARQSLGIGPDCLVAVAVGRVAKEKSTDELVRAWPQVVAELSCAKLVIVGGGPLLNEIKALAVELGVCESVVFTGAMPHDDIGRWYHIGDIFLCASTSETQGLTYFEAFAAKTPVCVRADDSCRGFLEDGVSGYTFCDEGSCAARIIYALKDTKKAAMAEEAYKRVARLSAENFGRSVEDVYLEMVRSAEH